MAASHGPTRRRVPCASAHARARAIPRRHALTLAAASALLLVAGCTGALTDDEYAAAIARAPQRALDMPLRDERKYWLLRQQPGWLGSTMVRFGGGPTDETVALVSVSRFRDRAAATAAFAKMYPRYLYRIAQERMTDPPQPVGTFRRPSGLTVQIYSYRARYLPDPEINTFGRLTVVQLDSAIVLIDSVGVTDDRLLVAVDAMLEEVRDPAGPSPDQRGVR
ncbi:MAG: hypothetical protein HYX51_02555 [Chloroflexi bacterium]|nr:hypothetical protein [Chloroflexota bacterium]